MTKKTVTERNTKSEILDAYERVLKELEETKKAEQKTVQEKVKKQEKVEQAAANPPEKIVKNLADLKLHIVNLLDEVGQKVGDEYKKLMNLQEAIKLEDTNLRERHDIVANADSLEALLLAQKQQRQQYEEDMQKQRAAFEQEMQEKRAQWKKEQEQQQQMQKEEAAELKKARQREQEEYDYQIQLERQKDADAYTAQKAKLERELEEKSAAFEKACAEREANIAAQEQELAELRQQVAAFPQKLEQAVQDTEQQVTERLTAEHQFTAKFLEKEAEGEKRLNEQKIASLEAKIKEQEQRIQQLVQQANDAGLQVQKIAVKALESSSSHRSATGTKYYESQGGQKDSC